MAIKIERILPYAPEAIWNIVGERPGRLGARRRISRIRW